MTAYVIHSRPGCGFCDKAKALLTRIGETFVELVYQTDEERERFKAQGFKTFPQIYRDGEHVGGFAELTAQLRDAEDF